MGTRTHDSAAHPRLVILLVKETLLDRYEAVAPLLEFGVGVMLVFLGAQVFYNLRRGALHAHSHQHGGHAHVHVHATHREGSEPGNGSGLHEVLRPQFRLKSYAIGIVHGLAGSAAVMLVLLPQIEVFWVGLGYLVVFRVGTIASMASSQSSWVCRSRSRRALGSGSGRSPEQRGPRALYSARRSWPR